jgi:hypothetical protein
MFVDAFGRFQGRYVDTKLNIDITIVSWTTECKVQIVVIQQTITLLLLVVASVYFY